MGGDTRAAPTSTTAEGGQADHRGGVRGVHAESLAAAEKADADLRDPSLFINRELSMLDFFERVVFEARDANNPLLERVKFVGIVGSILGEFFMVRIAGLRQQVEAGVTEVSADGYTPQKLLPHRAGARLGPHEGGARSVWAELLPELDAAGIHIVDYARLDASQQAALETYFEAAGLPGAHAAGLRPRTAVPAHLQHEPQPRRARARPERRGALRPRQGAGLAAAPRAGAAAGRARHGGGRRRGAASPSTGTPGSSRSSPPTWSRCSRAWRSSSRTPSA